MTDSTDWIEALRRSHDRLVDQLSGLDESTLRGPSYDTEWTIAQVASHLGSQAEIFEMFLDAGLRGQDVPGGEAFGPIWDRWNAKQPEEQVSDSVAANGRLVQRLEGLPADQHDSLTLQLFGSQQDISGFAALRLGEHAVHTWDIEVALDPGVGVATEAAELLVDTLPARVGQAGKPADDGRVVDVETTTPARTFVLITGPSVTLTAGAPQEPATARLTLPAEALLRLVSGRLDPQHTPDSVDADDELLAHLRTVFPGF